MNYKEWERMHYYRVRSFFTDLQTLSPIPGSVSTLSPIPGSVDGSSISAPSTPSPIDDEEASLGSSVIQPALSRNQRSQPIQPASLLPDLIVEVDPKFYVNKHDETDSFYDKLEIKVKRYLRRLRAGVYDDLDDFEDSSQDLDNLEEEDSPKEVTLSTPYLSTKDPNATIAQVDTVTATAHTDVSLQDIYAFLPSMSSKASSNKEDPHYCGFEESSMSSADDGEEEVAEEKEQNRSSDGSIDETVSKIDEGVPMMDVEEKYDSPKESPILAQAACRLKSGLRTEDIYAFAPSMSGSRDDTQSDEDELGFSEETRSPEIMLAERERSVEESRCSEIQLAESSQELQSPRRAPSPMRMSFSTFRSITSMPRHDAVEYLKSWMTDKYKISKWDAKFRRKQILIDLY